MDAIWEAEIPRLFEKIKADRKNLFEELDVFSQDTLLSEKSPMSNLDLSKVSSQMKLLQQISKNADTYITSKKTTQVGA